MRVKAIATGFDGIQIREPGEVFEFSGKIGKWMVPLDRVAEAPAAKAAGKAAGKAAKAATPKKGGKKATKAVEDQTIEGSDMDGASDDNDQTEE